MPFQRQLTLADFSPNLFTEPHLPNKYQAQVLTKSHIVSCICSHLDLRDIWKCSRVSTLWCDNFRPFRFRDINFAKVDSIWGAYKNEVYENAHLINKLTINPTIWFKIDPQPAAPIMNPWTLPTLSCTNLRELHCILTNEWCYFSNDRLQFSHCWIHNLLNLNKSAKLVCQNPYLTHFTFEIPDCQDQRILALDSTILMSLSQLQHLHYFKISGWNNQYTIPELLMSLPESLQEFEASFSYFKPQYGDIKSDIMIPLATKKIRRLNLEYWHPNYITVLLKNSPLLEDVSLPQNDRNIVSWLRTLGLYCPRIHTFGSILDDSMFAEEINETPLVKTLASTFQNLRHLELTNVGLQTKALLRPLANTLESLHLSYDGYFIDVGSYLRTFSKLREFRISGGAFDPKLDNLLYDSDVKHSSGSFKEYRHTPWICRNLELFECAISIQSDIDRGENKLEWAVIQIGQLYQELRTLKQLKSLKISWDPHDMGQISDNLEKATVFMAKNGQPLEYQMSEQDFLWMNINTPKGGTTNDLKGPDDEDDYDYDYDEGSCAFYCCCCDYDDYYTMVPNILYGYGSWNRDEEYDWMNYKILKRYWKKHTRQSQSDKHRRSYDRPVPRFYRHLDYSHYHVEEYYVPKEYLYSYFHKV